MFILYLYIRKAMIDLELRFIGSMDRMASQQGIIIHAEKMSSVAAKVGTIASL